MSKIETAYSIVLDGVGYSWKTKDERICAISDLSAEFSSGKPNIICGSSGAGKTTLGLLLSGLITPDSGRLLLDGNSIAQHSQQIAQVFQFPENIFFEDSIAEEFAVVKDSTKPDQREAILSQLQIDYQQIADQHPYQLSGGIRRMVAIALQVARDPCVLILDEPTVGLDWKYQRRVAEFLKQWMTGNRILIVITHDLWLMDSLGGKSFAMSEGQIRWSGATEELLQNEELMQRSSLLS
jgi:energy-coupling factor transporter ATP-binding protein EcfA2